jgi:flagellar motility protein MotE (MotC chaperone)
LIVDLALQFLFGVAGALVIVYLTIYEALPRMIGTKEIKVREVEIEELRKKWHEIAKKSELSLNPALDSLRDDYQRRESELRNEIRTLKIRQWTIAASLYVLLGGIFAMVIFPIISEEKIIVDGGLQSIEALKCMAIGFSWTTYISLIEGKQVEKEEGKKQDEVISELQKKTETIAEDYKKKLNTATEAYEKLKKNSKELIDKYKDLLKKK